MAQEEVVTVEDEAAELAAFEAAYEGADLGPVEVEPTEPEEKLDEPAPEPAGEEPKSYSAADVEAMIARAIEGERGERQRLHDRVFGTIGELKQRIGDIKATVGISPEAKGRLATEFPELAAMLFDPAEEPAQPEVQEPEPEPQEDPRESLSKEFAEKIVNAAHKDWRTTIASDQFKAWMTVQGQEKAAEFYNSWDGEYIADTISDFKVWAKEQADKAAKDKQKQARLEAAVTPQGMPRNVSASGDDDEEAAMMEAFNSRRK